MVPHNWVLVKPGTLPPSATWRTGSIADPEAVLRQYVPKTDDVLVYTDIVPPQQSFTIWFNAPRREGPVSVPLHVPRPLDGDEWRTGRRVIDGPV